MEERRGFADIAMTVAGGRRVGQRLFWASGGTMFDGVLWHRCAPAEAGAQYWVPAFAGTHLVFPSPAEAGGQLRYRLW